MVFFAQAIEWLALSVMFGIIILATLKVIPWEVLFNFFLYYQNLVIVVMLQYYKSDIFGALNLSLIYTLSPLSVVSYLVGKCLGHDNLMEFYDTIWPETKGYVHLYLPMAFPIEIAIFSAFLAVPL